MSITCELNATVPQQFIGFRLMSVLEEEADSSSNAASRGPTCFLFTKVPTSRIHSTSPETVAGSRIRRQDHFCDYDQGH